MKRVQKQSAKPKQLRAIQTSRHFHVVHSRHTGRVLPRASTSYPLLAMLVLCVGVLLAGWTHIVTADTYPGPQQDSYTVHAGVAGPAPKVAATIDEPTSGTHFTATPIIVNGTCPANTYVSLYRNNFYSGTAICDVDGNYQISTDLFDGANQLVARDFNFTDVAGPDSNTVTVNYDAPTPPPTQTGTDDGSDATTTTTPTTTPSKPAAQGFIVNSTPNSTAATTTQVTPLALSTDFTIRGYYVGEESVWQLNLSGGTAPYALAVDWGDGSTDIVSRGEAGLTKLTHTYQKPGGYEGTYAVKFSATDAAGNQTFLQLLVIVNAHQPSTVVRTSQSSGGDTGGAGFSSGVLHTLRTYVWPTYGSVTLMLGSFWLGELRELRMLKPHLKLHYKRIHRA
jgi:hypothetical protein